MSTTIKVTDPHDMISSINIIAEHEDIVLIHIDMDTAGKRAEMIGYGDNYVEYIADPERVRGTDAAICRIEFDGLPWKDGMIEATNAGRYTAYITLAPRIEGRNVYSARARKATR